MSNKDDNYSFTPTHPHQHNLVRSLNLLDIVMVGIAAMIGGAIFVLTGPAIGLAGSAVLLAFIINAIITLFTAMGYAELGSAMPEAGGGYLWIREGLPRPNAFISGWMAWLAHIIAGSLYSVGFGSYFVSILQMTNILAVDSLFGFIPIDKLIAVASIALFTVVNVRGTSETGKIGTIVTMVQLVAIMSLIIAGFWSMSSNPNWQSNFAEFMPMGLTGLISAMGLTFIAFEGYEVIVQSGEEVKNPKRNIPRAIFISLAVVVIMYCLVAFVSIGTIFPDTGPAWQFIGQNGDLGISKAAELFMPYGGFIVLIGGLVSTLAALNATTFSSARVAFAMGRHYNLPHKLGEIHPKFKTPSVSVMLSSVIMAVMAYTLPLEVIAQASAVIFLLLSTQVNFAVITIRRMYGDKLDYGIKTPFFPVIPIIGIILMMGLALYLLVTAPFSWVITALWVLIGFAIYKIFTFRTEVDHYSPIITSEGNLAKKDFRILMPYTPENPDRLIKYAIRVAKEKDGEINILRVITVPHQTPLSAGIAFTESAARAFEPLEKIIDKENILNHYFVRISHDATEAILSTIEEQRIDLLITDYETLRRNKALQTLLTCNILAVLTGGGSDEELILEESIAKEEKGEEANSISERNRKNMVVLYDGGDHSDMVLKTASWLEHSGRFKVIVLSIKKKEEREHIGYSKIDNEDIKNKKEQQKEQHVQYLEQIGVEFHEVFVSEKTQNNSEKFAKLILSSVNASQPDLVIMGKRVGKFNVFDNQHFVSMLDGLNCPSIVARSFIIPGVSRIKFALLRAIHR